jgi:hypothetical protein
MPDVDDTSPEAAAVQRAIWERMGPEGRLRLALRMSEDVRALAAAGIRHRHPDYDDGDVRWALFRLVHGDELFRKAWPQAPIRDP